MCFAWSLLRCGRRDGLEVCDDGVDLRRLEVMFEARHPRGAVADDLAHHVVLTAKRLARERRAVERAGELRLGVTDAARLVEQPHTEKLLVVERNLRGGRLCRCSLRPQHEHGQNGPYRALHPQASHMWPYFLNGWC